MDTFEILKIVKRKLFEPRKRMVYDSLGNKNLVDSNNTNIVEERANLSPEDRAIVSEYEGWNVADKDYVDYKIAECSKHLQQLNHSPSAPPLTVLSQATSPKSNNITVFYGNGTNMDEMVCFFNPGIILKKGWVITELSIISDDNTVDDMTLAMKNINDNKSTQISKIKSFGKNVVNADVKQKIDVTKTVVFELRSSKKLASAFSFQMTVEH